MDSTTDLYLLLKRRFPDVSQEDIADLALRIAEPAKVMTNMSHLTVYYIEEDQEIADDETFTSLAVRDWAKVRIMLVRGGVKVFLGPAWYGEKDDTPPHPHIAWDGRCTCGWDSSNYFPSAEAEEFVKEAKRHLEERH